MRCVIVEVCEVWLDTVLVQYGTWLRLCVGNKKPTVCAPVFDGWK